MQLPQILSDRRFRLAVWIAIGLSVAYLLINLFVIGGDTFVYHLNNNVANPLAIVLTVLAAALWGKMNKGSQSRAMWGGLTIGWAMWAVAEIWWAVAAFVGEDVPYPSWADFFWVVGYFPMILGLYTRVKTSPLLNTRWQRQWLAAGYVLWLAVSIFGIIVPAVQDYDPALWIQTVLNILYPVLDLVLLAMVAYLFFTYGEGDYGTVWRLLLIGFVLNGFADTLFSYADWHDLYYPDGSANFISTVLSDVPYSLSYLIWILSTYALHILLGQHRPAVVETQVTLVPNAHILFSTRPDDTIIAVSRNYTRLFPFKEVVDKPLAEALGLSGEEMAKLRATLRTGGEVVDMPVAVPNWGTGFRSGWLSAAAVSYGEGEYSGADIVVRTLTDDEDADSVLTPYEQQTAERLLPRSGEPAEIRQLLLDYHMAYFRSLYNLAFHEGGAVMAQSFLDGLQAMVTARGWRLTVDPQQILDGGEAGLDDLRAALPELLHAAQQAVTAMSDAAAVKSVMEETRHRFDPAVHTNVARYGK